VSIQSTNGIYRASLFLPHIFYRHESLLLLFDFLIARKNSSASGDIFEDSSRIPFHFSVMPLIQNYCSIAVHLFGFTVSFSVEPLKDFEQRFESRDYNGRRDKLLSNELHYAEVDPWRH